MILHCPPSTCPTTHRPAQAPSTCLPAPCCSLSVCTAHAGALPDHTLPPPCIASCDSPLSSLSTPSCGLGAGPPALHPPPQVLLHSGLAGWPPSVPADVGHSGMESRSGIDRPLPGEHPNFHLQISCSKVREFCNLHLNSNPSGSSAKGQGGELRVPVESSFQYLIQS